MAHTGESLRSTALVFLIVLGVTRVSAAVESNREVNHKISNPLSSTCSSRKDLSNLLASRNASGCGVRDKNGGRVSSLNVIPTPHISASQVSTEDFRANHLSPPGGALPLHIKNLRGVDTTEWTRPKLRELCGNAPLMEDEECEIDDEDDVEDEDCHSVKLKKKVAAEREWGGLESANLEKWGIRTWGDLMDKQDTDEGQGLYLHDASIAGMCPEALDRLPGMPKYFPRDYNLFEDFDHQSRLTDIDLNDKNFWDEFADYIHFPSIFIGKGGSSGSRLHSDAGLTRAFMLHLSGRKVWRLVSPKDHERLYPSDPAATSGRTESGIYTVDLFDPDFEAHPLLDELTVYEVVAEAGDVGFFPEGWPHQVRNLDDTIAISVNFVDNGNLDAVADFNRQDEGEEDYLAGFAKSFFAPLDDPPFRSNASTDFIPFRTYFKNQVVLSMETVPLAARRLVETRNATSARDQNGRTPLHSAAQYNLASVVKYLLDNGMDPNSLDDCGRTPLYITNSRDADVFSILKEHGGVRRITNQCREVLKRSGRPTNNNGQPDVTAAALLQKMERLQKRQEMLSDEQRRIKTEMDKIKSFLLKNNNLIPAIASVGPLADG